jgi:hypothetical protein
VNNLAAACGDAFSLSLSDRLDLVRFIMKGKRKAKTTKWLMKGQFEIEARLMLRERSRNASNHFLDASATFGVEHEPVGLLAGKLP